MAAKPNLEPMIDLFRLVMHRWHRMQELQQHLRALHSAGLLTAGQFRAKYKKCEEVQIADWAKLRPALRKLLTSVAK